MRKKVASIEELGDLMQESFMGVGTDLANLEGKVDHLTERVNEIPTRGEIGELIAKAYDYATMKAEHDRMKQIIHDKLGVEV